MYNAATKPSYRLEPLPPVELYEVVLVFCGRKDHPGCGKSKTFRFDRPLPERCSCGNEWLTIKNVKPE